jgi:hypothetical protein
VIPHDILKIVEQFSAEELRELRQFIDQREQQMTLRGSTIDMDALDKALAELRAGLTDEEFAIIERDMNSEYIGSCVGET